MEEASALAAQAKGHFERDGAAAPPALKDVTKKIKKATKELNPTPSTLNPQPSTLIPKR